MIRSPRFPSSLAAACLAVTLGAAPSGAETPSPPTATLKWHFSDPSGNCSEIRLFSNGTFEKEDCSQRRRLEADAGRPPAPSLQRGQVEPRALQRLRSALRRANVCKLPDIVYSCIDGTGELTVSLGTGLDCQVRRTKNAWRKTASAFTVWRALERFRQDGCEGCGADRH